MLPSDGPKFVIYVLVRLFHIFVKVIADKTRGNTNLVYSILRDIGHNSWIEFYKKYLHYIKLYTDEFSKTNEFKISEEHIIKERKIIIKIEYSYPDDCEITGLEEVKLLSPNQNGTTNFDRIKNAVTSIYSYFGDPRCPPLQAPEKPKIVKMAPETDAKTGSTSNNGTRDDGIRNMNTENGREDQMTQKVETFESHPDKTNSFGDPRYQPPQKNVRAVEHAPEKPKIEKIATELEAKSGSYLNNSNRDDGTRFSDIESGRENPKIDKEEIFENHQEETYEPPTSTNPANFNMNSETSPNYTHEVPDGKNTKIEASDRMVDNAHHVSERWISVESMPGPNQNEHTSQEIDEPTTSTISNSLFDSFLKDIETLNPSQAEPTIDSSQYEIVNFMSEEIQQMADEVSDIEEQTRRIQTDLEKKKDELEERSSTLYTPLEENVDTENGGFIEKLEEQKKRHEEELEKRSQERTEKQEKLNEVLREIRRLQKQKFAMLLHCIQLRYRFQEKEGEWSDWIEHCYRRLIVTVITQFADFQEELGVSEKAFRKTLKVSPETVQSEVTNLCGKIETTIHKLSRIFQNLAKIDKNFEDALFIRILQKSSCDISIKLISVLNFLDTDEYSTEWYQGLASKFAYIQTSAVPGVTELKRLCKEENSESFKNMEFPKWEPRSHVNIEELSSDEDEDVMEDEPKNSNDSSNELPESAQEIPMEFVKSWKGMTHPEDSKTASNSDRTETKDSQQIGQVVCSVPTSVGLNEVELFTCDIAPIVEIEEFSKDKKDIVKGKLEGFHKQITSKKTASIAEIEELLGDENEAVVEDKPENLVEVAKSEKFDFNDTSIVDENLKCSCECKKHAVDLENPSMPNNRTGKCSDEEVIKFLMGEILVRVSSNMDDNFENQTKISTRTIPRKELKTLRRILVILEKDEMVCEMPGCADKSWKKSQKVYYECQLRRRVYKTPRPIEKSNKMNKENWYLSSTKKLNSTEIMRKCLMLLYDRLLRQPLTWNRMHPMKITYSARVNNNYPPQLVRVWNEIVKKEKKFLDFQQIIELEKSKTFKLKLD